MATLVDQALTSVADVKELLGIASGDNTKNNLIIRKINQATLMIENYTGRRFKLTTYTNEEYDATGTNQLILRQRPVTSISSLSMRDTNLNEEGFDTTDTELYFLDANAGVLDLNFYFTGNWNRARVTYTAGYTTIPEDIQEAAAELAAHLVKHTSGTSTGVKRQSEGQRSVEYFEASGASTIAKLGLDEILDSYANNPVVYDV